MEGSDLEAVRRHTRVYFVVFAALAVLTVVTVWVSYLQLTPVLAITVALIIATIKGALVAAYFMHLISERKAIYAVLLLTLVFFLVLLFMPLSSYFDQLTS